jgi:hydroxyacylglutathione hydrolase
MGVSMIVRRLYEPVIAQASYVIGCADAGEALVIDPTRDSQRYLRAASAEGLRITHVTETHIHADFVSGARELAARTGAMLHLSDEGDANWKYAFGDEGRLVRTGDRIDVGRVRVEVLATPGHTPEHISFLVTDGAVADQPMAAATGDFLFVGDVGRPDLLERAAQIKGTMESSSRTLWKSLQAFARREDWLQIWPGHGAGSACGKRISAVPYSTLGYERRFNWAFGVRNEDEFVKRALEGLPDPPPYFSRMKRVNKEGPQPIGAFRTPSLLDAGRLPSMISAGEFIVDARTAASYAIGHLAGTLSLPFSGSFLSWAGWLLPYSDDLYFILDDPTPDRVAELARQLSLIGLDRVGGVFDAGAVAKAGQSGAPTAALKQVTVTDLARDLADRHAIAVDVRQHAEWLDGHIPSALHIPLGSLPDRLREIPADAPVVVHCLAGARSAIAASLLERAGRTNVATLVGGFTQWLQAGLPVEK